MKKRIFSGMRPTGSLHIGHLSVLQNWVALQEKYESYYGIVDWHALTTGYADKLQLQELTREIALDWLSVGIDPSKSAVFVQSQVKEHAELHLLLSMFTPMSWLERVPTYKDQIQQLGEDGKDLHTYGFLGYPLLMAADILIYKANVVPVGEDQIPHIELCREVARRFNHLYGKVFPEPQALIGKVPLLPGVDGRKMSKSYHNAISLTASTEEIKVQVRQMITDPQRIRKDDLGHPEVCVVAKFHKIYSATDVQQIERDCKGGKIGCVLCKKQLAENIDFVLKPYRERRKYWEEAGKVEKVLLEGAEKARKTAGTTMDEVRETMGI